MSGRIAATFIAALEEAGASSGHDRADAPLALGRRFGLGGYVARHRGLLDACRDEHLARRFHETILLEAAAEASLALQAAGIPHLYSRGAVLVGTVYDPGDREIADLDLFVPPHVQAETRAALGELGYAELPLRQQDGPEVLRSTTSLQRAGAEGSQEVHIDLHWGLDPVNRLLPRADTALPESVWTHVTRHDTLPAPAPAHHAALLVHHLVHHDMLHVRNLLDLALLRESHWTGGGSAFEETARHLGVLRAARTLHGLLVECFGFEPIEGVGQAPGGWRGRRLRAEMALGRWFAWAAAAADDEHMRITPRRVARRLLLLDRSTDARRLFADVVAPPRAHLRWRWPEAGSDAAAWRRHVAQVLGKAAER
jgi:hypothetical protein